MVFTTRPASCIPSFNGTIALVLLLRHLYKTPAAWPFDPHLHFPAILPLPPPLQAPVPVWTHAAVGSASTAAGGAAAGL